MQFTKKAELISVGITATYVNMKLGSAHGPVFKSDSHDSRKYNSLKIPNRKLNNKAMYESGKKPHSTIVLPEKEI